MRPACCSMLATTVTVVRRAEHLRQEFVGELDGVAFEPVAGLQQRAAQPRLDRMQCVASGGLLNLDQQHLTIAHDDPADGFAVLGNLAEARRRNARG